MGTLIHGFGEADLLADRAKKDENGNSLTLTIEEDKVTEIGGKSIGGGSSISITETTFGGIKDSNDNDILDSNNEVIGDANSETFVSGINDENLLAQRSYSDEDGNNFKTTYVKKEEILPPVIDGGTLTDAASITVENNALSRLSTSQSTLTLNVNLAASEIANFAVEIAAGANVTLTVTSTTGGTVTTLKKSKANGDSLESGKFYQVTCVGSCWTLAEFEAPSA